MPSLIPILQHNTNIPTLCHRLLHPIQFPPRLRIQHQASSYTNPPPVPHVNATKPPKSTALSSSRRSLLHHLSLLLRKTLSYPLRSSHELLHTPRHATLLAADQRFGREVVNAVVETTIYESGEHLWGERETMLVFDALGSGHGVWFGELGRGWEGPGGRESLTPMNSFICLRSMRAWNSRCSAAVRPRLERVVSIV